MLLLSEQFSSRRACPGCTHGSSRARGHRANRAGYGPRRPVKVAAYGREGQGSPAHSASAKPLA